MAACCVPARCRCFAPAPPVVLEQVPIVEHVRSAHLHHGFAPGTFGAHRGIEFIGEAGAADEGDCVVRQQQLAVIAQQIPAQLSVAQRIVKGELHRRAEQAIPVVAGQGIGAEVIEQHPYHDAAGARRDQRVGEAAEQRAGNRQIEFQVHAQPRAVDGLQHGRKKLIAVDEQLEAVALAPGEAVAVFAVGDQATGRGVSRRSRAVARAPARARGGTRRCGPRTGSHG